MRCQNNVSLSRISKDKNFFEFWIELVGKVDELDSETDNKIASAISTLQKSVSKIWNELNKVKRELENCKNMINKEVEEENNSDESDEESEKEEETVALKSPSDNTLSSTTLDAQIPRETPVRRPSSSNRFSVLEESESNGEPAEERQDEPIQHQREPAREIHHDEPRETSSILMLSDSIFRGILQNSHLADTSTNRSSKEAAMRCLNTLTSCQAKRAPNLNM